MHIHTAVWWVGCSFLYRDAIHPTSRGGCGGAAAAAAAAAARGHQADDDLTRWARREKRVFLSPVSQQNAYSERGGGGGGGGQRSRSASQPIPIHPSNRAHQKEPTPPPPPTQHNNKTNKPPPPTPTPTTTTTTFRDPRVPRQAPEAPAPGQGKAARRPPQSPGEALRRAAQGPDRPAPSGAGGAVGDGRLGCLGPGVGAACGDWLVCFVMLVFLGGRDIVWRLCFIVCR